MPRPKRSVLALKERVRDWAFAPAGGRLLALGLEDHQNHEIRFYDLANPSAIFKRHPGHHYAAALAASSRGLVASASGGGEIRLFDAGTAALIETVHGHRNSIFGLGFSPDGRRLISTAGGNEAVKLWDTDTHQELLTLSGTGAILVRAEWSADGNVILAGPPWQAWTAPSWDEIARVELSEKR